MRVGGKITKLMERVDLFMLMEISMMGTGKMITHMGPVCTVIWMELNIKEIGKRISSMVKELKHGLMVPAMRATMWKDASMDLESSPGPMEAHIKVNSMRIILRDEVRFHHLLMLFRCLSMV